MHLIPKTALARGPKTCYLLHDAISGKFQIVFDSTAKCRGASLNDYLLQGPDHAYNLLEVLLRFRAGSVVVLADIKAMFHQVFIAPLDSESLRFLWWSNDDLSTPPEEHQMFVHLFRATASPSYCGFALKKIATDEEPNIPPEVTRMIKRNFYIDDLLKSFDSSNEAIKTISHFSRVLKSNGFRFTKFVSNCGWVMQTLPDEDKRATDTIDFNSGSVIDALEVF